MGPRGLAQLIAGRSRASRTALTLALCASYLAGRSDAASAPPANEVAGYQPRSIPGMVRLENKAFILLGAIWKNPVVPVCWEPGTPEGDERKWVESAVQDSWNAAGSRLKFIGFGDCAANAAGIRIAVRDVSPDDGPHTQGLGSQLDRRPAGMVLNFTFQHWGTTCAGKRESCIRSIAVHEFGHAAGFAHEQNSPDTPGECAQRKQGPDGDLMLTPWDLHSVMNYCNPVYANDGVLSALDKRALLNPLAYGGAR